MQVRAASRKKLNRCSSGIRRDRGGAGGGQGTRCLALALAQQNTRRCYSVYYYSIYLLYQYQSKNTHRCKVGEHKASLARERELEERLAEASVREEKLRLQLGRLERIHKSAQVRSLRALLVQKSKW